MTGRIANIHKTNRTMLFAGVSAAGLIVAVSLYPQRAALAASNPTPAAATKPAATDTILVDALDTELKRAMSSLGTDGAAAQQPKPYFLSYAVDDATSVNIAAQYGAITAPNQSHRRSVDVQ